MAEENQVEQSDRKAKLFIISSKSIIDAMKLKILAAVIQAEISSGVLSQAIAS